MPKKISDHRREKKKILRRIRQKKLRTAERMKKIGAKVLRKKLDVESVDEILAKAKRTNIGAIHVRRSRDEYHAAIGVALALYYAVSGSEDPDAALTHLSSERPFVVTARTPPSLIVVRAVLEYAATEKDRRTEERRASRDAAALQHLFEREVHPEEVVDLGKKKGEGVEAWARARSPKGARKQGEGLGSPAERASHRPGSVVTPELAPPAEQGAKINPPPAASKVIAKPVRCSLGYRITDVTRTVRFTKRKLLFTGDLATMTVEVPDSQPDEKPKTTFKALVAALDARLAEIARELGVKIPKRST